MCLSEMAYTAGCCSLKAQFIPLGIAFGSIPSSETPGAVSGEKSKSGRKKIRAKKSQERGEEPLGDNVFNGPVPKRSGQFLASDWCQKTIVFFCPITEQQD